LTAYPGAPRWRLAVQWLARWWTVVALCTGIVTYTIYMAAFSIRRHDAFLTRRADLGHFDQTLWNTLHGNFLVRTDLGRQMLSFTDHVEPILAPLSLIYLVWEDVRMLLLFQSVALALGALPVYCSPATSWPAPAPRQTPPEPPGSASPPSISCFPASRPRT